MINEKNAAHCNKRELDRAALEREKVRRKLGNAPQAPQRCPDGLAVQERRVIPSHAAALFCRASRYLAILFPLTSMISVSIA